MDNRSQTGRRTGKDSSRSDVGSRAPGTGSGSFAGSGSSTGNSTGSTGSKVSIQPSLDESIANRSSAAAKQPNSESLGSAAASLSNDLKDAANSASRAVKEQASEFVSSVGHELSKTAEDQKARGVEAIQGFAKAITCAANELQAQSPGLARSVRDAATKVEGFSENIGNRDINELMKAATELARAQPMLFIGGAVAAGFALSRFLKSSASSEDQARTGHSDGAPSAKRSSMASAQG
jgi:hypothetical protein